MDLRAPMEVATCLWHQPVRIAALEFAQENCFSSIQVMLKVSLWKTPAIAVRPLLDQAVSIGSHSILIVGQHPRLACGKFVDSV
jgi:hypothetical protein